MISLKKKSTRVAIGSVVAAATLLGVATVASAGVTQTNGSDAALHFYDGNGTYQDANYSWGWSADVYGAGSATDISVPLACPAESTGVLQFIAPRGSERTKTAWSAYAQNAFSPGTKDVLQPNLKPSGMILNGTSSQSAIKAAGGNFSLGIACTTNSGATIVGAIYRYISVTAGTGAYTAAATADVASPTTPTTPSANTTASIALSATTTAAVDGALELSVPASAAATFGTPTLVNNKSTTTGTLPAITVTDGRVVSRQGWTLSASVAEFVNSADNTQKIAATNLGVAPSVTAAGSDSTGVTAGTAVTAGAATFPMTFASADATNGVGTTVLGGGLTFVAPASSAQGTYTSTMTLTLVSK